MSPLNADNFLILWGWGRLGTTIGNRGSGKHRLPLATPKDIHKKFLENSVSPATGYWKKGFSQSDPHRSNF